MNSKLFHISPHEAENPIDISLKEAFELLEHELRPPFPLNIPSPLEYSQLNRAILYGVLTETHFGKVHFTHLNAIVIDGYSSFVNLLLKIVYESYSKLLKSVKVNLIWVTSKLVDVSAVGVEGLLIGLMRQIVGGDFSDGNLWLSNELLKILMEKFEFLLEEPFLLTSSLYTYLRLLADHYKLKGVQTLEDLKRLEIDFCVKVLRNHFSLCLVMGRDLVRLLQDLILIPEFRAIWKDLLLNPAEFKTPEFLDISHLYCRRTSSRYFLLRITPEMEIQLKFLLTHVRWGHQKRYQAWFAKKFFCYPESETMICDIVRFICCAHHPPNEIIRSDVISRWAVIGWLLKCCRKNHVEGNTKLALFYDWLFFDEKIDNIMNIEPGILLMVKSIPEYIEITHTLLEFLVLLVDNYDVQRKNVIIRGVSTAFHVLEKNRVVDSLGDLISCNLLSSVLKERLSYILSVSKSKAFDERSTAGLPHCSPQSLSLPSAHVESRPPLSTYVRKLKRPRENAHVETQTSLSTEVRTLKRPRENVLVTNAENVLVTNTENVSSPVLQKNVSSCSLPVITDKTPITIIEELVQSLGETSKQSNKKGLQTLEKILFLFASLGSKSLEPAVAGDSVLSPEVLARQITEVFKSEGYEMFVPLKSPEEFSCDDEIQSATTLVICSFIFSQTKQMLEMILFWSTNGYPVGPRLLSYASRLSSEVGSLGNLMDGDSYAEMSSSNIPFLKHHVDRYLSFKRAQEKDPIGIEASASKMDAKLVVKLVEGAFASYRNFLILCEFSQKSEDTSLAKLLFSDLLSCCRWEKKSLKALFSSIFCYLSELSMSKDEFIKLVVGQFDHADLVTLQFELCLKRFSMFGKDTRIISHLVKCSLNWGFVEQQRFWGLMASELAVSKIQVEKIVVDCSVIIDPSVHSIATEGLFILCSRCAPTPALVGTVMSLPDNTFGDFAAAALANWVVSNGSMLFSSMAECLEKSSKDKDPVFLDAAGVKVDNSTRLGSINFLKKKGMKSIDCLSELPTPEITNALADAAVVQNRS